MSTSSSSSSSSSGGGRGNANELLAAFDVPECADVLRRWERWMAKAMARVNCSSNATKEEEEEGKEEEEERTGRGETKTKEREATRTEDPSVMASIFDYDLIIFPHVDKIHWSLMAACLPKAVGEKRETEEMNRWRSIHKREEDVISPLKKKGRRKGKRIG